jgi:signal transduction histidine kinase
VNEDVIGWIESAHRPTVIRGCLCLGFLIAFADSLVFRDLSIGVLFVIPIAISSVVLNRKQVLACAVVAALLTEQFSTRGWQGETAVAFPLALIAFSGLGLLIVERVQSRRNQAQSIQRLHQESELREKAEQEARALIESSPAAIITIAPDGRIKMTNSAAKRLLRLEASISGDWIANYFPVLGELMTSNRILRLAGTMVEGNGRRSDGVTFFAQMWLSSYQTAEGLQIAAVVADASDYLRDREEMGLRQLLMSSRVIAAAVSHEIRNIAAAADALHQNIGKSFGVAGNEDFEALGQLIQAMRKLSSAEVPASAGQMLVGVDVNALLRELNIIVGTEAEDAGVQLIWEVAEDLPRVRADPSGLLQVLLNLTHNSIRALRARRDGSIAVIAYKLDESVLVRFSDNGPGIAAPELLFQPFQTGATATGLGLCISRAIIRTFGGELQYLNPGTEGYFLIELPEANIEVSANA